MFDGKKKIEENKRSRQEAIEKLWEKQNGKKVDFWKNHIEWINNADQDEDVFDFQKFRDVYYSQLTKLINTTK